MKLENVTLAINAVLRSPEGTGVRWATENSVSPDAPMGQRVASSLLPSVCVCSKWVFGAVVFLLHRRIGQAKCSAKFWQCHFYSNFPSAGNNEE